jgi:hypothetical protein
MGDALRRGVDARGYQQKINLMDYFIKWWDHLIPLK